jgi:hypothetical protein
MSLTQRRKAKSGAQHIAGEPVAKAGGSPPNGGRCADIRRNALVAKTFGISRDFFAFSNSMSTRNEPWPLRRRTFHGKCNVRAPTLSRF